MFVIIILLFTDISLARHILWNSKDRLSGIALPANSVQLLYTKGLITHDRPRGIWSLSSSDYSLSQDELREIYAAIDNDHNKLRDFAEILLLTTSLGIDLLEEYCKCRV